MSDDYTKDELQNDLAIMVKAGLLDIRMREDGEWVYVISEAAAAMTEEEREKALNDMFLEYGDNPFE